MPRFEVTVTQRDAAPVDAVAATKCKCKCDGQLDPAAAAQRATSARDYDTSRDAQPSIELSPLAEHRHI